MGAPDRPTTSLVNGRLWGARAQDWASIQEGPFSAACDAVFDAYGLGAGSSCCDVGCGAAMAAARAAHRGATVSGLDAAKNLLAIARSRLPSGDFHRGDLEELPFSDDEFDLVTGFNSFQYAAYPVVALQEARRVAKPTGRVVIMTWGVPEGMEAASLVAALKPLLPPRLRPSVATIEPVASRLNSGGCWQHPDCLLAGDRWARPPNLPTHSPKGTP